MAAWVSPVDVSTAILTWAHAVSVAPITPGTPPTVGAETFLQSKSVKPGKKRPKIDGTSSFSLPGRADFFPGIQVGNIAISGIVDTLGYFDIVWSTELDNQVYAQVAFYYGKPSAGGFVGGTASPFGYAAVMLFEDASLDWETGQEGKLAMFSCNATVCGSWYKFNTVGTTVQTGSQVQSIAS